MSDAAKAPSRPMKYPYTHSARIAQFPYKFYWKNSWLVRYWLYASVISMPLFWQIQKLTNSESNVREWEEKRRKELAGHHEH